jgi:hypothetical protein
VVQYRRNRSIHAAGLGQHVLGQVRDDGVERGLTSFSRSSAAYAASPAEISPSWILAANSVFSGPKFARVLS